MVLPLMLGGKAVTTLEPVGSPSPAQPSLRELLRVDGVGSVYDMHMLTLPPRATVRFRLSGSVTLS